MHEQAMRFKIGGKGLVLSKDDNREKTCKYCRNHFSINRIATHEKVCGRRRKSNESNP